MATRCSQNAATGLAAKSIPAAGRAHVVSHCGCGSGRRVRGDALAAMLHQAPVVLVVVVSQDELKRQHFVQAPIHLLPAARQPVASDSEAQHDGLIACHSRVLRLPLVIARPRPLAGLTQQRRGVEATPEISVHSAKGQIDPLGFDVVFVEDGATMPEDDLIAQVRLPRRRGFRIGGIAIHPTLPSRLTPSSFCASTANSIGSFRNTCLQKPLTIMFTASSADRPRCLQ